MADSALENARNVTVHVPNVCARYVKIQLYFAARWMLISEITFDSGNSAFVIRSRVTSLPSSDPFCQIFLTNWILPTVQVEETPVADKAAAEEHNDLSDFAEDTAENAEDLVIDQSGSSTASNTVRERADVFNTGPLALKFKFNFVNVTSSMLLRFECWRAVNSKFWESRRASCHEWRVSNLKENWVK